MATASHAQAVKSLNKSPGRRRFVVSIFFADNLLVLKFGYCETTTTECVCNVLVVLLRRLKGSEFIGGYYYRGGFLILP